MRRIGTASVAFLAIVGAALPGSAARGPARSPAARFQAPVKVTPSLGGGYEPNVIVDRFGNIYASAHKENFQLVVAPDSQTPTMTRSMSWKWMSADDGQTWKDIPGLPLNLESKSPGIEGDMAIDGKDRLYFVDTTVHDVTLTRWTIKGRGNVTFDSHRPLLPAAQAVDDRPWITAHGDGHVYYLGNQGDKVTYPGGTRVTGQQGENLGGRYTLYASHDAGATFDPVGITLSDSGWCRPDADKRSSYVYVVCTNDAFSSAVSPLDYPAEAGVIWAYVSPDRGATWKRYHVGTYKGLLQNSDGIYNYPVVRVAPDGSLYALFVDAGRIDRANNAVTGPSYHVVDNRLILFHSRDRGRSWKRSDITPKVARYDYGWLAVGRDSKTLGLAVYSRSKNDQPWKVYASMFRYGTLPTLVSIDDKNPAAPASAGNAPGDYLWCDFGGDGVLSVTWTRVSIRAADAVTIFRDIYYARSVTKSPSR